MFHRIKLISKNSIVPGVRWITLGKLHPCHKTMHKLCPANGRVFTYIGAIVEWQNKHAEEHNTVLKISVALRSGAMPLYW